MQVLPAERIGVELTEGYVLVPEQSTAAIVVPHPQAKYYTTRPMNKGVRLSEADEEAEGRGYIEPGVGRLGWPDKSVQSVSSSFFPQSKSPVNLRQ